MAVVVTTVVVCCHGKRGRGWQPAHWGVGVLMLCLLFSLTTRLAPRTLSSLSRRGSAVGRGPTPTTTTSLSTCPRSTGNAGTFFICARAAHDPTGSFVHGA